MLPMQLEKSIPSCNKVIVLVLHVAEQAPEEIAAFAGACEGLVLSGQRLCWAVSCPLLSRQRPYRLSRCRALSCEVDC